LARRPAALPICFASHDDFLAAPKYVPGSRRIFRG
jgi:hypothetical protein